MGTSRRAGGATLAPDDGLTHPARRSTWLPLEVWRTCRDGVAEPVRRCGLSRVVVVIVLATIGAAALRAPIAAAGLPYVHHPDEPRNVRVAEGMVVARNASPGFFAYPALTYEAAVPGVLVGVRSDDDGTTGDEIVVTQTNGNSIAVRPRIFLLLRWLVGILPDLLAVAVAGAMGWAVTRRWWVAGMAAALVALCPLDLEFASFVTPDSLAGATAGLAVLTAVRVVDRPSAAAYALAGAAVGLATAAKYNAALTAVAVLTAHVLTTGWRPWRRWQLLGVAGATAAVVLLVTNPAAIIDNARFVDGLRAESAHYRTGHPGWEGGALWYNVSALWHSAGLSLLLCPLAALAPSGPLRRHVAVVGGFTVGYLAFVSAMPVRFARNLTPLIVPLAVLAAIGVCVLVGRLVGPDLLRSRRRPLAAALVGAALVWPAISSVSTVLTATEDPWADAQAWIDRHVPAGSGVAVENYGAYIDPERYRVLPRLLLVSRSADWYRANGYSTLVASETTFQRYLDADERYPRAANAYRALLDETCVLYQAGRAGQRIIILAPRTC